MTQNISAAGLVLLLLITNIPESMAQVKKEKVYAFAYNNGNAWCVLEKPESSAMFFDMHYSKDSVELLEYHGGDYYKVRSIRDNGRIGYIYKGYLQFDSVPEVNTKKQDLEPTHQPANERTTRRKYSTYSSGSKTIQTGPRGGKYYINSNGKKTYVKRK